MLVFRITITPEHGRHAGAARRPPLGPRDQPPCAATGSPPPTTTGSRMMNVEPAPGALSTAMSPPIRRQNSRERARPRPVPPYLAAIPASAWLKRSEEHTSELQ